MSGSPLVRDGATDTSIAAAIKAARSSKKATDTVRYVMADGVPRIDQEIWAACRSIGYISSLSTIQHGRVALSNVGVLVDTGRRRLTEDGENSIVWCASGSESGSEGEVPAASTTPERQSRKMMKQQALRWRAALYRLVAASAGELDPEIVELGKWLRQAAGLDTVVGAAASNVVPNQLARAEAIARAIALASGPNQKRLASDLGAVLDEAQNGPPDGMADGSISAERWTALRGIEAHARGRTVGQAAQQQDAQDKDVFESDFGDGDFCDFGGSDDFGGSEHGDAEYPRRSR